ncbi:hypothetical protein GCM10010232_40570 [Streptomyces amakusaensis]
MKIKQLAAALPLGLALALITGCGMGDSGNSVPSAGTKSVQEATSATKQISSELLDLIGIKGESSEPGPGVSECGDGKDREKYFTMYHPWSFVPASGDQLAEVMERLKAELPGRGWKIVEYGPDSSQNKNLNLTADNDERKFSVNIVHKAKGTPQNLSVTVVSGCYQVPDGQRVEHF